VYRSSAVCLVWFVFILPFVFRFSGNATQKFYLLILKNVVTISVYFCVLRLCQIRLR